MKYKPINLAFLGCGFATRLHSKTLSGFKKKVHCYYASRDKSKAQSYNEEFGGHGVFSSYEDAINSGDIDVVLVATPPAQHLDLTFQALHSGKQVIVEKPPFLKSAVFDTVQKAIDETGNRVFVAENYFYKPLLLKLKKLIQDHVIGDILFVHVNALKEQETKDWRGDTKLSGGGALFEGGIHWINFIANLGLKIKSVRGLRPGEKNGPEMSVLVNMQYEEGPVGSFYYSWETPSLFKGLRLSKIYGREGSITFESNGVFVIVRGRKKRILFPGFRDIAGYKAMFRDFIHAIQENREPQFTLSLAKQDVKLIEDIYQSLRV